MFFGCSLEYWGSIVGFLLSFFIVWLLNLGYCWYLINTVLEGWFGYFSDYYIINLTSFFINPWPSIFVHLIKILTHWLKTLTNHHTPYFKTLIYFLNFIIFFIFLLIPYSFHAIIYLLFNLLSIFILFVLFILLPKDRPL